MKKKKQTNKTNTRTDLENLWSFETIGIVNPEKRKSDEFALKHFKNRIKILEKLKKNFENLKTFSTQFYERFLKNQNPHQTPYNFPAISHLRSINRSLSPQIRPLRLNSN